MKCNFNFFQQKKTLSCPDVEHHPPLYEKKPLYYLIMKPKKKTLKKFKKKIQIIFAQFMYIEK